MKTVQLRRIAMRHALIALLVCPLAAQAAQAAANVGPLATLKQKNSEVETILRQKVEKDSADDKKNKDTVKQVAATLLDYNELGKRAMAEHWDVLKPAQRDEFISTFKEMLERNYVKGLKTNLDYQVQYKEEKIAEEEATCLTVIKVKTKGRSTDAEIVYKMHKTPNGWQVWDIITDEVSLLRSYKNQFHRIISDGGGDQSGYPKLLEKMKSKLKEST
jgi:phospholipid transport system substrate-binding protein